MSDTGVPEPGAEPGLTAAPGRPADWRWVYQDGRGRRLPPEQQASPVFSARADAESWVGESWRELVAAGVDSALLLRDEQVVGPAVSLRPSPG